MMRIHYHMSVRHPKMQKALAELEGTILAKYPDVEFMRLHGEDPCGTYLIVTVDIAEPGDVGLRLSESHLPLSSLRLVRR